jgi:capsular exopolysaccharide synthesis family protein
MSRVDEARRRATIGDDAQVEPLPGVREDESILEAYPRERRSGAERASVPMRQAPAPVRPTHRPVAAPRTGPAAQLGAFDPGVGAKLVGGTDISPVAAEQYRRLAASLHQLQMESGLKTLMVTSAMPREGKTLTVTNLALTLSESYRRRVLLIDADLRRASIHQVLRLPNTVGLSEALRSDRGEPQLLQVSPMLSVLTAGQVDADPMGALTSERMAALLNEWSAAFDWVLLDAPPVGLMPDGNVLARLTKAVVFVIAAGSTPHRIIERAITELGRDYVVGTVLNRIDEQQLPATGEYREYFAPAAQTK